MAGLSQRPGKFGGLSIAGEEPLTYPKIEASRACGVAGPCRLEESQAALYTIVFAWLTTDENDN